MRLRRWLLGSWAAFLGLWGIGWGLPEAGRAARVLPPGSESLQFHERLAASWLKLHRRLGEDILLHPEAYSPGFHESAAAPPGWTNPPELLLNSARSFYLRSGHEDESDILFALSRIRPQRLQFNPRIYFYGGTYLYPLGAWIALGSFPARVRLTSDIGYYLAHPGELGRLYLLGRLFSAAAYGFGAWLLWLTGKKFFGAESGLFAAALYASAPGIALQAHYMKPHLLGAALVLLCFYFCAALLQDGKPARWIWAGAMLGLAGGCAITLWSAAWIPALTLALRLRQGNPWKKELLGAAAAALAAVGAYALADPFALLDFPAFWKGMGAVARFAEPGTARLARFLWTGLPLALTWPSFLCVLAGTFSRKSLRDPVRLLAAGSFIGLALASWIYPVPDKLDSVRYFPGAGLGLLLAGVWLEELGPRLRCAFLIPALCAGAFSLLLDYNLHLDASGRSTRQAAGNWIEDAIPAGAELGFLRLPQPSNSPYFQWSRYRLKFVEPLTLASGRLQEAELPETLVLASPSYDDRPRLRPLLARRYVLLRSFEQAHWGPLAFPAGHLYGNPLIEIYKKSNARRRRDRARRVPATGARSCPSARRR